MKRVITIVLSLILLLSLPVNTLTSEAKSITVYSNTTYIDAGEDIVTGTYFKNNLLSLSSDNEAVAKATINQNDGSMTIEGIKEGTATITLRLGTTDDYKDYKYPVTVLSAFDNVTFSYDYDKITVNYDKTKIPNGCTPVFSIDGSSWSESATLTRNKDNDGVIYKAYKVNNIISGSLKMLTFDTKYTSDLKTVEKSIEMYVGDTYKASDDFDQAYYTNYLINGRSCVEVTDDLYIKATDTGNTSVTFITIKSTDYDKDGNRLTVNTDYVYSVKVKETGDTTESSSNDSKSSDSADSSSSSSPNAVTVPSDTEGKWMQDANGWWFMEKDGSYPVWDWRYIDGKWYFFDRNGYMDSSAYRFGCWLNSDGSWDTSYSNGKWKNNANGWWYEDNGWYPTNQWLKIDGYWYYFKADGYMATDQWIGNYYVTSNGSMATDCYIGNYWVGSDGAWVH